MATVNVSTLYHKRRLLDNSPLWTLLLLLYTPFGLVLAALRLFLFFQLSLFLWVVPKGSTLRRWWFRGVQPGLGFIITSEGFEARKDESPKVLVSNNVTLMDHAIVESLIPCAAELGPYSCPVMYRTMGHSMSQEGEGAQSIRERTRQYISGNLCYPLLTHPEDICGTGSAVTAFKCWPLSSQSIVQPIVISSSRPIPLAAHYYGSTRLGDLFFFFFVPWTTYHVRLLPAVAKTAEESNEEFCKRVQEIMADSLGVPATQLGHADVAEHVKRSLQDARAQLTEQRDRERAAFQQEHDPSSPLDMIMRHDKMARQVLRVFPNAPYQAVLRDLELTNSVDNTITNILEGKVPSESLEPAPPSAATKLKSSTKSMAKTVKAASTKAMTFEERKQQMLEQSRERFLRRMANASGGSTADNQ